MMKKLLVLLRRNSHEVPNKQISLQFPDNKVSLICYHYRGRDREEDTRWEKRGLRRRRKRGKIKKYTRQYLRDRIIIT